MATATNTIQGSSPKGYDGKTLTPLTQGSLGTATNVGTNNLNMGSFVVPPTSNVINSDSMKPVSPVPLADNTVSPNSYTSAINQTVTDLTNSVNTAQKNVDTLNTQGKADSKAISDLQSLLGGKVADTAKTYNETGVTTIYNQLADLNAQATGLKNESLAIPIQIQNEFKGTGATDAGVKPIETSRLRDNALKALSLGQQAAIASAQYDKAKNYADQIIESKYAQIEADIKAKQTNLSALKDFELTPAQNKLLKVQEVQLKYQEQQLADKKAEDKVISEMIINASQFNAPASLLTKAKDLQSKGASSSEVATALGQYGGDYYKTELLKQQILTEKAQRSKIYNDINQSNQSSVGVAVPSVSAIDPTKFKDASARTEFTKAGAVIEAVNATTGGAKTDGNGNYYGLGYFGGNKPEVFLDQKGQSNRAFLGGIELKVQQWASGASLTESQVKLVQKMVPKQTDADSVITNKLKSLKEYMEGEQKAVAITQGQRVAEPEAPNPFKQALGQGTAPSIVGTSIIKGFSGNGNIMFDLPTTTKK